MLLVASNLAYLDKPQIEEHVPKQIGFENVKVFMDTSTETQGFVASDDEKVFVVFGGNSNLRFLKKRMSLFGDTCN